jgi:hypothetical protein
VAIDLRKPVTDAEEIRIEGGPSAAQLLRLFPAAVVRNPWKGCGFVEDLRPEIHAHSPLLGRPLTDQMLRLTGSGDAIEGYGKAAMVGIGGELEHASALIQTLRFSNHFRHAVRTKNYLASTNTRGARAPQVVVLLTDQSDTGRRSYRLTIQFSIKDVLAPHEIVVAPDTSVGGRPRHGIGDRYQDLEELGSTHG